MSTLVDGVVGFLERDGWFPTIDGDVISCGFQGEHGEWTCYVIVIEDEQRLVFYSSFPDLIPDESRRDVAELFLRINFPLMIGSFDLDLDDGEVRFRTSLDVEGGELTDGLVSQVAYANVNTMNHYFELIRGVAASILTPAEALAEAERDR